MFNKEEYVAKMMAWGLDEATARQWADEQELAYQERQNRIEECVSFWIGLGQIEIAKEVQQTGW